MRTWILLLTFVACSGSGAKSTTPAPELGAGPPGSQVATSAPAPKGCPPDLDHRPAGHCAIGTQCGYAEGECYCDGRHGGTDEGDRDVSQWVCGRTRNRTDGCPDDLAAGGTCTGQPEHCKSVEGAFCGPMFRCVQGRWDRPFDTCRTLP